jgi:hypothetical protein
VSRQSGERRWCHCLKATIALHGYPCDKVLGSKRNADSDYTATCKDHVRELIGELQEGDRA